MTTEKKDDPTKKAGENERTQNTESIKEEGTKPEVDEHKFSENADAEGFEEESDDNEMQTQTEEAKLKQLLSETEEKYTRLVADFDNYKKRNQIELSNKLKYAQQSLAKDLCIGLDNLELAIEHAKKQENSEEDEFLKGIEMVLEKFISALEQNNITRIGEAGELFDPSKHEAVGVIETGKAPSNHIENVFQAGYMLYDRVIRPAMVQVSKK